MNICRVYKDGAALSLQPTKAKLPANPCVCCPTAPAENSRGCQRMIRSCIISGKCVVSSVYYKNTIDLKKES